MAMSGPGDDGEFLLRSDPSDPALPADVDGRGPRDRTMLRPDDEITAIDCDRKLDAVVARTRREIDCEVRLHRKVRTSGCARGTVFDDVMDRFEGTRQRRKSARKDTA